MSSSQNRPPHDARNHPYVSDFHTQAAAETAPALERPARTALIVASPSDRQTSALEQFTRALRAGGIVLVQETAAPNRLDTLIRSMQDQIGCVVLPGEGRSFRAAALALRDTGLPIGIFPISGDNDLVRRLAIPSAPTAAAALILAGHKRSLDLGMVNGQPFFCVASVGLTVDDARLLGRAAHHPLGRLAFSCQAARLALRTSRFAAIIRCGSVVHRAHSVQITIGNGRAYVSAMEPGSEQPGQDGMLEVYSLEPASKWQFLFLRRAFRAGDGSSIVETRRASSAMVEIVTRLPRPITADGAIVAITPARFTILPKAIDVFVPAPVTPGPIA